MCRKHCTYQHKKAHIMCRAIESTCSMTKVYWSTVTETGLSTQSWHRDVESGVPHRWPDEGDSHFCTMSPLLSSSCPFLAWATISGWRCPCASVALPGPWPWTGSSPRPETAASPELGGALPYGCAGKDCTASLRRWWKDSKKNRPGVRINAQATFS